MLTPRMPKVCGGKALSPILVFGASILPTLQQTIVPKAEAALATKIKCEDFRKNTNGTWTSAEHNAEGRVA